MRIIQSINIVGEDIARHIYLDDKPDDHPGMSTTELCHIHNDNVDIIEEYGRKGADSPQKLLSKTIVRNGMVTVDYKDDDNE